MARTPSNGGRKRQEIHWSLGATAFRLNTQDVALKSGETASKASDLKPQQTTFVIEVPRAKPTGTIVLRGGTAITMKGDQVIPNADIVVKDSRIIAIGKRGTVAIPAGAP